MRVPNLDWPADLFTDVTTSPPKKIMVPSTNATTKPALWKDMVDEWIGNGVASDLQWRAPLFSPEQIFL